MRRLVIGAVIATVMLAVAGAGAAWWVRQQIDTPYQGFTGAEQFVDVPPGTSTAGIARRLVDAGVVADAWTFRVALWWTGQRTDTPPL